MGELEDMINGILSDSTQMEQITKLAQSLMGGAPAQGERKASAPQPGGDILSGLGMDTETLGRISRLINGASGGKSSESQALLEAMKPYLTDKRREKVDRAMRLARLAKLAGLAMGEMGVDGDDK